MTRELTHLDRLEAESIFILRETVAEAAKPVMLYSMGKDQRGDAAPGAQGVLSRARCPSRCSTSTRPGSSGTCTPSATRVAAEPGIELIVYKQPGSARQRHQPVRPRAAAHRHVEDRGAEAGARQITASTRRSAAPGATRRKAAPRSGCSASATGTTAGTRSGSGRSCGRSTMRKLNKGESDAGVPAVQLDRARRLAIYPARGHRDRAALLRGRAADGRARRRHPDGRRRAHAASSRASSAQMRRVRFRTLGCYPLSGAVESDADDGRGRSLPRCSPSTAPSGRAAYRPRRRRASMEKKKQEGYF